MTYNNKLVLVTGATRGIGKSIATRFAKAGAIVIGTATTQQGAEAICQYLGTQGTGVVLDVTKLDSIDMVMSYIKEHFGDVDILVNNAGITRDNLFIRLNDNDWDAVIATNLTAVYHICKKVIRPMLKKKGRIINIGSVVGHTGNAGQVNYATAKAGLMGLTKALAKEVAVRGITVNLVSPGFIATDMTNVLTEAQQTTILSQIPVGRMGLPEDVANAVFFLASEQASYITGETIHVNGGMYMA